MHNHFSPKSTDPASNYFLPFTSQQFEQDLTKQYKGRCISGAQPKLTMYLQLDPNESKGGDCLVKPSANKLPYLAENEYTTMSIMRNLGFEVPPIWLAQFVPVTNQPLKRAFVIRRFDRNEQGVPIHQEQLDAAMNATCKYGETDPDSSHSMISYERVYQFLSKHLGNTEVLSTEFYKRIITAYLLGNCDLHLRNFAIVYDKQNNPLLSPIYDYVAVCAYPFIMEHKMALPLRCFEEGGQHTCLGFAQHGVYTGKDFIDFGTAIGLNRESAEHHLDELFRHVPTIIKCYRNSLLPNEQVNSIERWINTAAYHFIEFR
jgi:serine/threonine-protein kinase HipA